MGDELDEDLVPLNNEVRKSKFRTGELDFKIIKV